MKFFYLLIGALFIETTSVRAEIIDADTGALAIFGSACEDIKAGEQNASTRMKAMDKASFSAVSSLPEIVNIKDSFDEHDFNVMVYNIVDDYIEDMSTKTIKQDNTQICVEISGYITTDSVGQAIDKTIQEPNNHIKSETSQKSASLSQIAAQQTKTDSYQAGSNSSATPTTELLQIPAKGTVSEEAPHIIVLSTIFVKPTEFYNHTQSGSHSRILKNILSQSQQIKIVDDENEANFIITPKVLKAKIEPLNNETSRMQMVVALETFDRNKNTQTTEHQNKFVLFNTEDNEQAVAKELLTQLFEQGSSSLIKQAEKSSSQTFQRHKQNLLPEIITAIPSKTVAE